MNVQIKYSMWVCKREGDDVETSRRLTDDETSADVWRRGVIRKEEAEKQKHKEGYGVKRSMIAAMKW